MTYNKIVLLEQLIKDTHKAHNKALTLGQYTPQMQAEYELKIDRYTLALEKLRAKC